MESLGVVWFLAVYGVVSWTPVFADPPSPPNIVIIMADDMGWNDVSFHGSEQFMTPNIDALAYSGVILDNYYTQPICTPARAALLSGRHPIHTGMEHDVIYAAQPWGLPLTERVMPQYLESLGYASHLVGKWHLGFFRSNYTPTRRGFQSHYGTWLGHQDSYTHDAGEKEPGYDFHRNLEEEWDAKGHHNTDLFTSEAESVIRQHNTSQPLLLYLAHTAPHAPLQAPQSLVDQFKYIPTRKRRLFAAMVTQVDESVGKVVHALKEKDMLENSIIVFVSDNGGATHGYNGNVASNWPLRGGKDTLWEGGVRAVGLVWSPLLANTPRVHSGLVNVLDWLPTFMAATGTNTTDDLATLDGMSQWDALQGETPAPYVGMLHNIDPCRNIGALRVGKWKLIQGRTYDGAYDGWYGQLNGQVEYDVEAIRSSVSGKALQSSSSPLPATDVILSLRNQTKVTCDLPVRRHHHHHRNSTGEPHEIVIRQANLSGIVYPDVREDPLECQPHIQPCLFDLEKDPCEQENLASLFPDVLQELLTRLRSYKPVPPGNRPDDPRALPHLWNNTWVPWMDHITPIMSTTVSS